MATGALFQSLLAALTLSSDPNRTEEIGECIAYVKAVTGKRAALGDHEMFATVKNTTLNKSTNKASVTTETIHIAQSGRRKFYEHIVRTSEGSVTKHIIRVNIFDDKPHMIMNDKVGRVISCMTTQKLIDPMLPTVATVGLHSFPFEAYLKKSDLAECISINQADFSKTVLERRGDGKVLSLLTRESGFFCNRTFDRYDRVKTIEINTGGDKPQYPSHSVVNTYADDTSLFPSRMQVTNNRVHNKLLVERDIEIKFTENVNTKLFDPAYAGLVKGGVYPCDTGNAQMQMLEYDGRTFVTPRAAAPPAGTDQPPPEIIQPESDRTVLVVLGCLALGAAAIVVWRFYRSRRAS